LLNGIKEHKAQVGEEGRHEEVASKKTEFKVTSAKNDTLFITMQNG